MNTSNVDWLVNLENNILQNCNAQENFVTRIAPLSERECCSMQIGISNT